MWNSSSCVEVDQPDITAVTNDLLWSWLPSFIKLDWKERLALLQQIDTQLAEDSVHETAYRQTSHLFTSKILQKILQGPLDCSEQASLFLYSGDDRHRQAARAWFTLNWVRSTILDDHPEDGLRADRRSATRQSVRLPIFITTNNAFFLGRLVDISTLGAKLEIDTPPPAGTSVMLEIPLLGRAAALVAWVAAAVVGLSFVNDQLVMAIS